MNLAVDLKFVGVDLRTSENKMDEERRLKYEAKNYQIN